MDVQSDQSVENTKMDTNATLKQEEAHGVEKDYSDHLLVLQHGLHGNEHDWGYFKPQMEKQYKGLIVHCAKSNASFLKTQDGIENAGNRLSKEIFDLLDKSPAIKKISMIGHSLGVGKLYDAEIFSKVKPAVFMTIASPNVGSRRPMRGAFNKLAIQITARFIQRTGTELLLEDETPEGVPMLVLLARQGTSFMKGLALFESRILYSNVKSDVLVPYCTAAILHKNPYKGEKARKVTLSKKYPHIIEHEEKEETTLEVDKGDLEDIKDELLGEDEAKDNKEDHETQDKDNWQYGEDGSSANHTDQTTTNTNTNPATTTTEIINKRASTSNKQPALSEQAGVDGKNAGISKETVLEKVVEKLFEKDLKGEHLMEILQSLQTLTWKRYDVYFETWFLAHTHVVVKRAWINTAGSDVVRHIVDNFTP